MLKNIIPKENIPKIAEVREIKNEIPTYEEFLKSYEQDEKINYDDLTCNDISLSKGCGPCSRSDCNCQYGERWMDLRIPCPAEGCNDKTAYFWLHTPGCGSKLEVSNKTRIRCSGCSFVCRIKDYQFRCSRHPSKFWFSCWCFQYCFETLP